MLSTQLSSANWKRKGKQRARDEGQGGSDGVVLPLDAVANGEYDISYTIPILVGPSQQNFSLQVDTGSSDLWIASTSCTTSSCAKTNGKLYDPSQATQTGEPFDIQYLLGNVSGPIVWDDVDLGGYNISNQALAAADNVQAEPLSGDFQGVLGLALPLNSIISGAIPPVIGNSPDGASFASNLFGITPSSAAPSARFLSLCLSRPGSDQIPSMLGIGRHPSEVVSDPSQINYGKLVSERDGDLFWKAVVKAITVYVDSQPKPIALGISAHGGTFPTATLDTGVPLILTTSAIANGIYGALGISPGNDGQYYVPCTQPLNMTFTLDDRPEIPIHPLDLTADPQGSGSPYCIGLIQTADAQLTNPTSITGDMVLGVPFLRNVYTVMAYDPPDAAGNFHGSSSTLSVDRSIDPRLGLLNLTNPTVALEDFKRVRVLNQPLSTPGPPPPSSPGNSKKLSVGIDVLIGLVSFVAFCFILFAARWFFGAWVRRRAAASSDADALGDHKLALGAYRLARRGSQSSLDGQLDEEALRRMRFESYMKRERMTSEYTTTDSARTRVNSDPDLNPIVDPTDGEFGYRKPPNHDDSNNKVFSTPAVEPWNDTTLVGLGEKLAMPNHIHDSPGVDPGGSPTPRPRARTASDFRRPSVSVPLLVHVRDDSRSSEEDLTEFGVAGRMSMAGIGTAARSGRIDMAMRQGSVSSLSGVVPVPAAAPPAPAPALAPSPPKELPKPRRIPSGPRPLPSDSPTSI